MSGISKDETQCQREVSRFSGKKRGGTFQICLKMEEVFRNRREREVRDFRYLHDRTDTVSNGELGCDKK